MMGSNKLLIFLLNVCSVYATIFLMEYPSVPYFQTQLFPRLKPRQAQKKYTLKPVDIKVLKAIYAIPHCQDKNRPTLRMNSAIQQMDAHHD